MSTPIAAQTGPDTDTIDALKRIKAAEAEWDAKVAAARASADTTLKAAREATERAIVDARASADAERQRAVENARAMADLEARAIVADGERAAKSAADGAGKRPADRKDEILAALLGRFAGE